MYYNITITFIISMMILFSCSTTNKTTSNENYKKEKVVHYSSLADYIRGNSNVRVTGVDPNIRLELRGASSLTSDTRPFIYINRNPIGRDYARANNLINPNDIERIEVITNLADLTRYGQEGHSGIIKIHTKNR